MNDFIRTARILLVGLLAALGFGFMGHAGVGITIAVLTVLYTGVVFIGDAAARNERNKTNA